MGVRSYDYTYVPVPGSPEANKAYIFIAEDTNFPADVPGPPSPIWDSTAPIGGPACMRTEGYGRQTIGEA